MSNFVLKNKELFWESFVKYDITSPLRIAYFLGQLAHESQNFTKTVERISYKNAQLKYQNHKYLGNKKPGDGYRFRGRGLIQLTGRGNYQKYKDYTGIDVVNHPELASKLENSIDIACWYWRFNSAWGNLNHFADKKDIISITKGINGGLSHLEDRIAKTELFKKLNLTLEDLKKKAKLLRVRRVSPFNYSFFNPFKKQF